MTLIVNDFDIVILYNNYDIITKLFHRLKFMWHKDYFKWKMT